jgi:hypothetical protein
MDSDAFKQLALQVFPDATSSRLARARGSDQRVVQRWLAGQVPVPDDVSDWITEQARIAGELKLQGELDAAAKRWQAAGLDDEAIAAALAAYYQHVIGRRIS